LSLALARLRLKALHEDHAVDGTGDNPLRSDTIALAIRRVEQIQADLTAVKTLLQEGGGGMSKVLTQAADERPVRYIMFSDGRRKLIIDPEYAALKPEGFRFFLDLVAGRLLAKVDRRRPTLRKIAGSVLQSEDVRTLAFMVEHAGKYFGADNLAEFLDGQEDLTANTLARRMVRIRREVQQGQVDGPFIRRATNVDISVSRTGFGFHFDGAAGPYCLVRFARPTEG
jgi:hypothetical protein